MIPCEHKVTGGVFFIHLFCYLTGSDEEDQEASCFMRIHLITSSSGNLYNKRGNGLISFKTRDMELQVYRTHLIPPSLVSVRSTAQVQQQTADCSTASHVYCLRM
jgi:hypothetical protein